MLMYAGAGLSQHIWDGLDEIAAATCGERIAMITGLGCTETSPSATFASSLSGRAGLIGPPVSGIELKLVPSGRKTEMRVRGPSVTPGYWRAPELTAKAFDTEGFFCTGDAVRLVDADDPDKGLLFDGRITEDFKLTTGTWVSAGPLRTQVILHCAPLVRDVVLAGRDRNDIAALIFPDVPSCRALAGLPAAAPVAAVLAHPAVHARFQELLDELAAGATGSATRVARALLMEEAPTVDTGEATDKGSLNCAAVLDRRAALVEQLYAATPSPAVLIPRAKRTASVA
jgi:feruloyl-CoA synthase